MPHRTVEFKKLKIHSSYGKVIKDIYYVVDNNRSKVMESFQYLSEDERDLIKDLISKMATVEKFNSSKINHNLKGYNYGEIKPMPHRFFFFQKCGNNIIFFGYELKKKRSLGDAVYRKINKEKERYEKEFKKFIQGSR